MLALVVYGVPGAAQEAHLMVKAGVLHADRQTSL